jgi:formate-dependent nitrite reductase cytochrome c552 subunit
MSDGKKSAEPNYGWWIAGVLFLTALSFVFDLWGDTKKIRQHPPVDEVFYSTHPVRESYAGALTTGVGLEYRCSDCHDAMEPPEIAPKVTEGHEEIVLRHEEAMTCYTCHSRTNRDALNDIYGTEVSFVASENICHRCHGPRYRDWKLGIHGRMQGYWDKTKGEKRNITCVSCHDPHAPAFQLMKPSPMPSRDNYINESKGTGHE